MVCGIVASFFGTFHKPRALYYWIQERVRHSHRIHHNQTLSHSHDIRERARIHTHKTLQPNKIYGFQWKLKMCNYNRIRQFILLFDSIQSKYGKQWSIISTVHGNRNNDTLAIILTEKFHHSDKWSRARALCVITALFLYLQRNVPIKLRTTNALFLFGSLEFVLYMSFSLWVCVRLWIVGYAVKDFGTLIAVVISAWWYISHHKFT